MIIVLWNDFLFVQLELVFFFDNFDRYWWFGGMIVYFIILRFFFMYCGLWGIRVYYDILKIFLVLF